MKKIAIASLALGSVALGQEFPNPNPVPQADGTFIWYVGNNTQYPVIQDVLEACSDGDEVVVSGGTNGGTSIYVESLHIDNISMLTVRPRVMETAGSSGTVNADSVHFLNPTEGFNNNNDYAMKVTGSRGTYVGRPRSIDELGNGSEVVSAYNDSGVFMGGSNLPARPLAEGEGGFTFRSRTNGDVCVLLDGASATIDSCDMEPYSGNGGGVMALNGDNSSVVGCTIHSLQTGTTSHEGTGLPVTAATVHGSTPSFSNCDIEKTYSGSYGSVNLNGGAPRFEACEFNYNEAMGSDGMILASGGEAEFFNCDFRYNYSGEAGVLHWDATNSTGMYRFTECDFEDNSSSDSNYAEIARVLDNSGSMDPKLMFSRCYQDQGGATLAAAPADNNIITPHIPEYRIASDWQTSAQSGSSDISNGLPGDLNGDSIVDTSDLDELMFVLGTCGNDVTRDGLIDFADVLSVLSAWGNDCE